MTLVAVPEVTTNEWLQRAQSLSAVIEEYRDQSEQQRYMARPIFDAIAHTRIFEMMVPRAIGGPQADLVAQLRVIEEVSRQDGSAGWNVMIWSGSGLFADYLSPDTARELLTPGQGVVIGGALNPTGYARPTPGGFRISGRWSFASGCHYLKWFLAGCVVLNGDSPRLLPSGVPEVQAVLLPAAACQIIDTWRTAGLRGTGSHDFVVDDVFVPIEHSIPLGDFFSGSTVRLGTAYRTPFYDLACPQVAAVGLGIARAAINAFEAMATRKTPTLGSTLLVDQHTTHQRLGEAEALLRSARAYLYGAVEEVTGAHQAGAPVRDADAAALRLAASHCAQSAVRAVDIMFEAGGGTAVFESSKLERCFRDVHMVTHHMMAGPSNIEMVGQFLLGGPLQPRR